MVKTLENPNYEIECSYGILGVEMMFWRLKINVKTYGKVSCKI